MKVVALLLVRRGVLRGSIEMRTTTLHVQSLVVIAGAVLIEKPGKVKCNRNNPLESYVETT